MCYVALMKRYHLAMFVTGLLASALAFAQPGQNAADMKEIRDFRLNMDNIQRYLGAFKLISNDPAAKKCGDKDQNASKTLDDSEKAVKACPGAMADLAKAGIKPREFVVMTGTLMSDFMSVSMKKAGQIKDYPPSVSPENIAFLEQNYDKLQAMMSAMSPGK
jgi:hypothetical protein